METKSIADTLRERNTLMDTAEIAELMQMRKETVLRYVREGKLPGPIKIGDLLRWDPKMIADSLYADKPELAKQVAAWLCKQISEGHEFAVPEQMFRVLETVPGYLNELRETHSSTRADKEELLHNLRKRFRYKCEVLLSRQELIELLDWLRHSDDDEYY
jgi:predicted DNA-binding transcriptional regulator AlpA